MDLENLTYDIETHPVVTAIVIFIVGFVVYDVILKKNQNVASPSAIGTGATNGVITPSSETYNQTFNSYPTVPTPPVPQPSAYLSALAGQKVWQGTKSHVYFYGPNGPMPGKVNQNVLQGLFPTGTVLSSTGGNAGDTWYYLLPGASSKTVGGTLVDPNPPSTTHPHPCKKGFMWNDGLGKCVKL